MMTNNSLSWVPFCTSLPCGQLLDQTRWQDGNSRCRPSNKQFVIQNQWGRVVPFLSQDRPSRSLIRSKTPNACTSYWNLPAWNKRQGLKCPSANRLHAFANLIHRSVNFESGDSSVCSALRFEPRDRVWFLALNFLGHDETCREIFEPILYHTKYVTGNFTTIEMKISGDFCPEQFISEV